MRILVLYLCIQLSIGRNIVYQPETATASPKYANRHNRAQIEVVSLDSYNFKKPLIIRSKIPDSLRPSREELKNSGYIVGLKSNGQNDRAIFSSLESFQANSQLFPYLPTKSVPLGGLINEDPLTSSNTKPFGINAVPISDFTSMADFTSLLNSETSFGVGLMSLEVKNPPYPESVFQQQKDANSIVLIPAQLQLSKGEQTNDINNNQHQNIFTQTKELQLNGLTKTNEPAGYVIEKVPEIVSFTRFGPLLPSDIPSFSEIEAIFNKAAQSNAGKNPITEDYRQIASARSGFKEATQKNISITKNLSKVQQYQIDGQLYNIVNITTNVSSKALVQAPTNNGIINKIDGDTDQSNIAYNISSVPEIVVPQPLSAEFNSNLPNSIQSRTLEYDAVQDLSSFGSTTSNLSATNTVEDTSKEYLENNLIKTTTLLSSKKSNEELLGDNETNKTKAKDTNLLVPVNNNTNFLGNLTTGDVIALNNNLVLSLSNSVANASLKKLNTEILYATEDAQNESLIKKNTAEEKDLQFLAPIENNSQIVPNVLISSNTPFTNKTDINLINIATHLLSEDDIDIQKTADIGLNTDPVSVIEIATLPSINAKNVDILTNASLTESYLIYDYQNKSIINNTAAEAHRVNNNESNSQILPNVLVARNELSNIKTDVNLINQALLYVSEDKINSHQTTEDAGLTTDPLSVIEITTLPTFNAKNENITTDLSHVASDLLSNNQTFINVNNLVTSNDKGNIEEHTSLSNYSVIVSETSTFDSDDKLLTDSVADTYSFESTAVLNNETIIP